MPDAEQEHTNQNQPGPQQKPVQPSAHATELAHEWGGAIWPRSSHGKAAGQPRDGFRDGGQRLDRGRR
jgi:hypothetical protein